MSAQPITIPIQRLPHSTGIVLPAYATESAVGMDLRAAIAETLTLVPGATVVVPCGFRVAIPEGYEGQIRPRSGIASKHGVVIPNSPGTIDPDYRGEVAVALLNLGSEQFTLLPGSRFAQLVIAPVVRATWDEATDLPASKRGDGGFGHTGR